MGIQYAFDRRPKNGETQTIEDGLDWLRMPLPFSLNHINLWLLRDGCRWAIVDTGVSTSQTVETWHAVFDSGMGGDPASHVIATHMHPDHVGCAGFLTKHFGADFWMARDEYMMCRILVGDTGRDAPAEGIQFYRDAGFDEEQLLRYQKTFGFFGTLVEPLPEAYKRLRDGDCLSIGGQTWRAIAGGGHSPEHVCLFDADRKLLIAGDQLLPTISSNVSVWPTEPLANPLRDWFESLRRLRSQVPNDVLVLPAHGKPFRGAHERIDAIVKGHEDRLDALRAFCTVPQRAVDVLPALFRRRIDDDNRIMATGEALAHLHYLAGIGEITSEFRNAANWYQTVYR